MSSATPAPGALAMRDLARPSTPASARARRASSRGGTPRGRGTGRRCGGRSTSTGSRPSIVRMYTRSSSPTTRSPPSTSVAPIRWARNECSKYAELKMPGVSTAIDGSAHAVGRERAEQLVELVGVGVDRRDALAGEHLGERPLGDGPVLEHVAHAGRHAQVVLEHVHRAVGVAHEVGAGDVRPHAELRVDAPALGAEVGRVVEQLGREHAVGDDALVVVEVVDEPVERHEALDRARARRAAHSVASMTRGMTSNGHARSMPPASEYTVNVMPKREDVGRRRRLAGPQLLDAEVVDDGEHLRRRRPRPAVARRAARPRVGWAGQPVLIRRRH